jgi:hypothetical protein
MSSSDKFGPADAWWSLFSFALAPSGAHFLESTDTGVASAPGQKRAALQTASAPVSSASVASSPTLKEATTTAFGNSFARTEPPHWSSQRFQAGDGTQPFKVYVPNNLAVTYPDLYAGAAIHSGIAFGVADEHLSALCAMNDGKGKMQLPEPISPGQQQRAVPLIVSHGDADDTVHPRNGEQIVTMSRTLHGDFSDMPAESMCSSAGAEGHASTRYVFRNRSGAPVGERWVVHELGHAWSGGFPDGTYTDLRGPCATREIVRFFEQIRFEIRQ